MRARRLILGFTITTAVLASPALSRSAGADGRPTAGGYVDPEGNPTAVAGDGISTSGSSGGRGGGNQPPCTPWRVAVEDDFAFAVYDAETGDRLYSETGRWLTRSCLMDTPTGPVEVFDNLPEGELVDPEALALEALESVTIPDPTIGMSPPAGSLVVQVPTWLWLSGDWWRAYEATATAGRVSATVTAEPVETSWSMGDGSTVTCSGPGVAWTPGAPEDATDCSHTYTSTSADAPGGTFGLTVTVSLEVGWSSNSGAGGTFDSISRTAGQAVRVGEIQAVETE